jgi:DNA-directed RNA polymerase specialized sigma24 family protein
MTRTAPSDAFEGVDLAEGEKLAARAADGDKAAWTALVERLWDPLHRLLRTNRSMGGARSEDDVRDVLTKLFSKLGAQNGRGLKLYGAWRARHPDKTFEDWLRIVAKNVVRDRARETLGARGPSGEPSVKRLLNEFAASPCIESLGFRPPVTAAQTARQLLAFARSHLPREQHLALRLWLDGASFEEIEGECELEKDAARKLVRAAVAVLRRQFADA